MVHSYSEHLVERIKSRQSTFRSKPNSNERKSKEDKMSTTWRIKDGKISRDNSNSSPELVRKSNS